MDLGNAVKKRRSVRKFSHKKPDWRKIVNAIDAARLAPMAGNYFVNKFIIVSDEEKIHKLAEAAQQSFISKAPFVVVVVSDPSKVVKRYGERGTMYTCQQSGAAIENFLLAVTDQKLVATWIGHFFETQVKELLKIPDELTVEALLPVGNPTAEKPKDVKKVDLENVIYFEKWGQKYKNPQTRVRTSGA